MANRNDLLVPQAENMLEQMKTEIAAEFGIPNYNQLDKGDLTARQNGAIGGEMVKRLVAYAEQQLSQQPATAQMLASQSEQPSSETTIH
jgi:hypothetical protein